MSEKSDPRPEHRPEQKPVPTRFGRVAASAVLAICIVAAACYSIFAVRSYMAFRKSERGGAANAAEAVRLEPGNAAYHALFSRELLLVASDPTRSLDEATEATRLNPYDSGYWLDLALAFQSLGRNEEARTATRQAVAVNPTTPDLAWDAGNMYLLESDPDEALKQFAVVMAHSTKQAPVALDLAWRAFGDVNTVLSILPPDPELYLQFVHKLTGRHETQAAAQVWSSLLALNRNFDFHSALFYVDYLLAQDDIPAATAVWNTLTQKSPVLRSYAETDNLVINGKFSKEILNSGFDWRYVPAQGIELSLQEEPSLPGTRSLCITYDAENYDAGVDQSIPVEPSTEYVLSGLIKTDDIRTANGPSLSVVDVTDPDDNNRATLAATPPVTGTGDWHQVSKRFTTGPDTKLVSIGIRRDPGNTRIRGQLCVANPSIRKATP